MTEYTVLIIGDDERWWDRMGEEERAAGMAAHEKFSTALAERGHVVTGGAELHRSGEARSIRPGSDTVVDGPYAEAVEQVGGYYVVESGDLDDLLECCRILVATGDGVEVRAHVEHGASQDTAEQPS